MNKYQAQMLNEQIQKLIDQVDALLKEATCLRQRNWLSGLYETAKHSLYLSVNLMKDSVDKDTR